MREVRDIIYDPAHPDMGRLDIYLPEEPKAVYLYLHGGGMTHGDKASSKLRPLYEALTARGIAVFSANYRFLPLTDHDSHPTRDRERSPENGVPFPEPVEDCARALGWILTEGKAYAGDLPLYIGGSSAGAYMAMLLMLDEHYLRGLGLDPLRDVAGYLLDAGQPTTHFHLLELQGDSEHRILVDQGAPLWYLRRSFEAPETLPRLLVLGAERDIPGRVIQNQMFVAALENFGYPADKINTHIFAGYRHCGYLSDPNYLRLCADFLTNTLGGAEKGEDNGN